MPVAGAWCTGIEPSFGVQTLLDDEVLVFLPRHAVRWVGHDVVEAISREAVLRERVAELDVVGVLARHQCLTLGNGVRLLVQFLAVCSDDGLVLLVEVATYILVDISFAYIQHAAGAACRVVDGAYDARLPQLFCIRSKEYCRHKANNVSWSEVLTSLLIALVVGDADEFLKYIAHLVVIDGIEREVQLRDLLYHAVEEVITVEPRHNLVKLEASKDGTYLRVEACHVVGEVHGDVLRVVEQGNERVARRVVKLQFSCRLPQ